MRKSVHVKEKNINLITLKPEDDEKLFKLLQNLSDEDLKWSMSPYKREWIKRWLNTPTLTHLAGEHSGEVVCFVCVEENTHPRMKGIGYLGAYVHKDYANTDLLSNLLGMLLDQVENTGLHKLNTEEVSEHKNFITMFKSFGFIEEGRKIDWFYGPDEKYYDTIILGKVIKCVKPEL